MTFVTLVALIVVAVLLWRRVEALQQRVDLLEWTARSSSMPSDGHASLPPVAAVAPATAPLPPARVVAPPRRVEPAEAPVVVDPEPLPVAPSPPTGRRFGFEDLFGRKLPIWAGGATLAVCGALIVKYSIETGLLSPLVRVIAAFLFGGGLIAGAEAARRAADRVRDPRVPQALAGAGVATLYAAVLVATDLYHLVPPLAGFVGLAGVTLLAALLSLRFGAPSAVLGLLGGLAAPALVSTGAPDVPLLAAYLALAIGGLAALGRGQRWPWLGLLAIGGGFGWGLVMLSIGVPDAAETGAIGLFLLFLGIGLPVLLFGGASAGIVRGLGALAATAELTALMVRGGFRPLDWALFGLLSVAIVWLSTRERALRDAPAPALGLALLMMAGGPIVGAPLLVALLVGVVLIFGVPAGLRVWRADGRRADAGQVAAIAVGLWLVPWLHLSTEGLASAAFALLGAAAAGGIAALGWRAERQETDRRFALLAGAAALMTAIAGWAALVPWLGEPATALVGLALLLLAPASRDRQLEWIGGAFVAAAGLLLVTLEAAGPLARAWGDGGHGLDLHQMIRWALPAAVAALFARRARTPGIDAVAAGGAVLAGYVALAQVVPTPWLPLVPAAALALLGAWRAPVGAQATAAVLAATWALLPLLAWLVEGAAALVGSPMFATALPGVGDALLRLLAPALAAMLLLWRDPPAQRAVRRGAAITAAGLAGIAVHIAWKQLFAIGGLAAFVRLGLAERTLWEAALALAAAALLRRAPRVATALGGVALAHLAWFTLLLHDPLWSAQAVGAWPVANLLLPTYALAVALLWAAGRTPLPAGAERARQVALMLVIGLFVASELRQLAHGSLLAAGVVKPAEDIARSIAAIALAIGFLQWGIRRRLRDWRIASLLLMLVAVGKVFLLDAAGLDGLLRIASFAALGFSLIGIGWLYSRYLPSDPAQDR